VRYSAARHDASLLVDPTKVAARVVAAKSIAHGLFLDVLNRMHERGFAGAMRGCKMWVYELDIHATWVRDLFAFYDGNRHGVIGCMAFCLIVWVLRQPGFFQGETDWCNAEPALVGWHMEREPSCCFPRKGSQFMGFSSQRVILLHENHEAMMAVCRELIAMNPDDGFAWMYLFLWGPQSDVVARECARTSAAGQLVCDLWTCGYLPMTTSAEWGDQDGSVAAKGLLLRDIGPRFNVHLLNAKRSGVKVAVCVETRRFLRRYGGNVYYTMSEASQKLFATFL